MSGWKIEKYGNGSVSVYPEGVFKYKNQAQTVKTFNGAGTREYAVEFRVKFNSFSAESANSYWSIDISGNDDLEVVFSNKGTNLKYGLNSFKPINIEGVPSADGIWSTYKIVVAKTSSSLFNELKFYKNGSLIYCNNMSPSMYTPDASFTSDILVKQYASNGLESSLDYLNIDYKEKEGSVITKPIEVNSSEFNK
ncbi:MAG: hypothetical protein NTY47_06185, partial [Candidatus Omnitrophica bacterium]|nr:hypothetical protein [Candidatus Omnitrophota bacterium]